MCGTGSVGIVFGMTTCVVSEFQPAVRVQLVQQPAGFPGLVQCDLQFVLSLVSEDVLIEVGTQTETFVPFVGTVYSTSKGVTPP